jgi:hypothetical protein
MSSINNSNAIKTAMTQLRAAVAALDAALGTPAVAVAVAAAPSSKKKAPKAAVVEEEIPAPVATETKVRKPTAWNAYVTENGGVKKASALKKEDPAAYEAWAAEWKVQNPDPVAVPVKAKAEAAEPKARKPRSDKGKARVKKPVAEDSAAESAAEEDE